MFVVIPFEINSFYSKWLTSDAVSHAGSYPYQIEVMYNISSAYSMPGTEFIGNLLAEFTVFGSKGSVNWWQALDYNYWPNLQHRWTIKQQPLISLTDIGELTGIKIRYGSNDFLEPVTWTSAYAKIISSFIVTTNICNSGECKATVFTTAPSVSKTIDITDATATYFKLYPLNEFATSRAFTSNFVL